MRTNSGILLLGILLSLAMGCKRTTPADAGARDGVFHFANNAEISDLDPATNVDANADRILSALFEGLVIQSGDGKRVLPGASDRWTISPDGLTYTFHLRDNGRWSNGEPVTADDFLFAFRRVFDPALACEASSFGFSIVGARDRAEGRNSDPNSLGLSAPDAHTFIIRLKHPTPYFLWILAASSPFQPVYPPSVKKFDGVGKRGGAWTRPGNLISNGGYQLAVWQPDRVVIARRNPYYWNASASSLAEIRIYPIESPATQEMGFRAGQFHVTGNFPLSKVSAYAAAGSGLTVSEIGLVGFLTFNVAVPPYNDPRVRRALSLAIDRDKIIGAIFGRLAVPAFTLVRPGIGGYFPTPQPAYRLDRAKARALLSEAGYPGGKNFPAVSVMIVGNAAEALRFGEAIQSAWKNELGIETELHPTESKVYLDAERTKHYTIIVDHWGSPWDDPTAVYQTAETGNPNNDSGWSNPEFDRAFHDSEENPDPAARIKDFDAQEAVLAAEVPYAPLYFLNRGHLIHPAVRNWPSNHREAINWNELSFGR